MDFSKDYLTKYNRNMCCYICVYIKNYKSDSFFMNFKIFHS